MSNRPEKIAIRKEVRSRLEGSSYVILTDCRGMTVQGLTDLRQKLRGASSRLSVVSNAFLNLASKDVGWTDVEQFLDGPTAMITGTGDVSQVAKVLRDYVKAAAVKPRVKGGRYERQTLSAGDVDQIASIPSREVMLTRVVCTVAAPLTRLVGVLQQKTASVVQALKAYEDKRAKAGA